MTVIDHTPRYLAQSTGAIETAIRRGTSRVQREARRLVSQQASPPPSAPGEPPHLATGTLARSIEMETFRDGADLVGRVGTNLKYGRFLEFGTARMAPRPFLRPALQSQRPIFVQEIGAAMRRVR